MKKDFGLAGSLRRDFVKGSVRRQCRAWALDRPAHLAACRISWAVARSSDSATDTRDLMVNLVLGNGALARATVTGRRYRCDRHVQNQR